MIIRKQWNHNKSIISGLALLFVLLISPAFADEVNYFYDDSGRLVTVTNTANNTRALYQYDEVGNLIAIFNETSIPQALPPVLQGIEPDIFLIGGTYNVIITGQNLLTTNSVTSDNPDITIKFIAAIDSKIIVVLSIANIASPGQANITVTTSYGSASMTINLYKANITPAAISLFPANSASLSVSLTPSAPKDVTVTITNKNPDIVNTPYSVTIPAGGSGSFTVDALKDGTGIVGIGNAEATVFVVGNDSLIASAPVSVLFGSVPDSTVLHSSPVTVTFSGAVADGTVLSSMPVSILWDIASGGTVVSLPVGVEICSALPVKVVGTSTNYYSTLQSAYNAALDGDTIQSQAIEFTENLNINLNKSVILDGGYNCDYTSNTGNTELKGTMTISGGTVKVKNFILKK